MKNKEYFLRFNSGYFLFYSNNFVAEQFQLLSGFYDIFYSVILIFSYINSAESPLFSGFLGL